MDKVWWDKFCCFMKYIWTQNQGWHDYISVLADMDKQSAVTALPGYSQFPCTIVRIWDSNMAKATFSSIMKGAAAQPQGALLKPKLLKFSINWCTPAISVSTHSPRPREEFHGWAVTVALHAKWEEMFLTGHCWWNDFKWIFAIQ